MSWRPSAVLAATVLGAPLALVACGGGAPAAVCGTEAPPACSEPAPSYTGDIAPLVQRLCGPCHTAGGVEATAPFDTYEQVRARRVEAQTRLQTCLMPPADQPQPSASERAALLAWLACGAPGP